MWPDRSSEIRVKAMMSADRQSAEVAPMVLPIMTPEQRMDALAKATEARHARSVLLAQVQSGELALEQVFERTDDEVVKKTLVLRVLRALPGYGPAKATALMDT